MSIQEKIFDELKQSNLFNKAKDYGLSYSDAIQKMDVFPKPYYIFSV